jgi:glycine/D-amino acid oxidase-like deaminating enzyme/nitrite reductase/ring-hydroxylating ferredoxin subunit
MKSTVDSIDDRVTSGKHHSYWLESSFQPVSSNLLKENLHADVVIVGGGLAGVSVAYCLIQAGKKVILVEDGQIGSGESGRTTAHLVTALDDRYSELEKIYGEDDTKLIAESHKAAIQFVEETVQKEKIDCQFERVNGYLFLHPSDDENVLKEELIAATKAGVEVKELDQVPGILNYKGACLEFADQAQFHPMLYMKGLCRAIIEKGGRIFTGTHAKKINHEGIITEDGFSIKANHVVVTTNTPVNNLVAMHLKQTAFRTYVIAGLVRKGSLPKALWWDTGDHHVDKNYPPYHYVRTHPYSDEFDLLISGGEDHPTGDLDSNEVQEEDRYKKLEEWTKLHFPLEKLLYCWSGQVLEPVDSLAFIGRNPLDRDNVYIVTGDSGTGMTHCTIGGMLITDMILGKKNPWEEVYRPSRITMKTGDVWFKELIRGLVSVLKMTPQDERAHELSQVQYGDAKIIHIDGHQCGVYRDEAGEFHIVSAKCTHLKGPLHWNADEKSWDCPWHGSRFTCDGRVINGPANKDLPAYEESAALSNANEDFRDIG